MRATASGQGVRYRACALAVAVTLLAVVATAGQPSADTSSADTSSARVASILAEVAHRPPDEDALLAQQIVKLGQEAVPVLFDRLERRAELVLASAQGTLPGGRDRAHAVVLDALRGAPRSIVRAELLRRAMGSPEPARRGGALFCMAAIGGAEELPSMFTLAEPALDPDGFESPFERIAVEALHEVAHDDPMAWRYVLTLLPSLPIPTSQAVLRGAAADAGMEALELLAHALDVLASRRLDVLAALQAASARAELPVPERVRRRARELMESGDDQVAAQSALLCGKFEDSEAAEALVGLLQSPSASVRRNAHWSLRRISGLGLREDPRRWRAWLDDEQRWWSGEFEHARARLSDPDVGVVRAAILDLGRRRLGRERLTVELVDVLAHSDVDTAEIAARAIGALGSRAAMTEIEAVRADLEPRVRSALDAAMARTRGESSAARSRLGF